MAVLFSNMLYRRHFVGGTIYWQQRRTGKGKYM